jgi:hypothetical protein
MWQRAKRQVAKSKETGGREEVYSIITLSHYQIITFSYLLPATFHDKSPLEDLISTSICIRN